LEIIYNHARNMLDQIEKLYGLPAIESTLKPFGDGLINHTWVLECNSVRYILQQVNDQVFTSPSMIAENIHLLDEYFKANYPGYFFVAPVATLQNEEMVYLPGTGYLRMFPFVKDSQTFNIVEDPVIALEAAKQFGKFTRLLSGFDTSRLKITLPDFHNLNLRYQQFETALSTGNEQRIREAGSSIAIIKAQKDIVAVYNAIQNNGNFKCRVTHHDTKISNVLFDSKRKGLCVIDLDTVMPGFFISDVGDMIRTYLSPVSEEETDFSKIRFREEYFQAVLDGYFADMQEELSPDEKKYFVYAGKFMIYMQALRFITDHINNDIYYGAKYEGHNLLRGNNQLELLKQLCDIEPVLQQKVSLYLNAAAPGI
jgi:Ser/Thr protein kinase RdoA (MazF antagonist)